MELKCVTCHEPLTGNRKRMCEACAAARAERREAKFAARMEKLPPAQRNAIRRERMEKGLPKPISDKSLGRVRRRPAVKKSQMRKPLSGILYP